MKYRLGFLGAGNMAEAIAAAAVGDSILASKDLIASDPSEARREVFAGMGITATADNAARAPRTHVLWRRLIVARRCRRCR